GVVARAALPVEPVGVRAGDVELGGRLHRRALRATLLGLRGTDICVGRAVPAGAAEGAAEGDLRRVAARALAPATAGPPLAAAVAVVGELCRRRVVGVDNPDALDGDARAAEVALRVVPARAGLRGRAL